jgi:hypothetical protein
MTYPITSNNFRSGDLVQGQPLGATNIVVSLTADNQFVSPYGFRDTPAASLIFLQSNNTTASNRTFTLNNGQVIGQGLTLIFESGSSYTCQLANSGNVKLTAAWEPLQYQSLNLEWDGTYWIELGRAPASIASTALASAHIFVGSAGGVATDVAMTGDIAITNAGVTSIAAGVIVNADVSASAAIDYSKLATLTSGNVLVGSAGNVATSVTMSGDATIIASGALTIGANAVTSSKLATNVMVISSTVSLTQANIIAMGVTPVEILAAASAGTYYVIDQVEFIHTYSTAAYTGGGDVQLQYDSGAVAIALFADTIITAASSSNTVVKPTLYGLDASTGTSEGFAVAGAVAKSVTITNAGGAFADGNAANIAKLRITYRVITALV